MKNNSHIISRCFTLLVAFLVSGEIAFAGKQAGFALPETILSDIAITTTSESKLTVSVSAQDSAGIITTRCYFRYASSVPYIYAEMNSKDKNRYTCEIPYPAKTDTTLDFLILAVNGNRQIVVSPNYQSSIAVDIKEIPVDLLLHSETKASPNAVSLFADHEHITIHETPVTENYGVLAGLYNADQVKGDTVPGYFGAFTCNHGTMAARQGLAISLDFSPGHGNNVFSSPARVDLSGEYWSGEFYRTDDYAGTQQDITASITQNAGYVVVVTTSLEGLGHQLVGKIYSSNHLLLYDQYDGEDWTTHYGPASEKYVLLADYVWDMHGHPLNIISLHRATFDSPPTPIITNKKNLPAVPALLLKQ